MLRAPAAHWRGILGSCDKACACPSYSIRAASRPRAQARGGAVAPPPPSSPSRLLLLPSSPSPAFAPPSPSLRRTRSLPVSAAAADADVSADDSAAAAAAAAATAAPLGVTGRPLRRRGGRMANSRFEYVKQYEQDLSLLPGCYVVVRVDGRGFTRFSALHGFEKPNDRRALDLMDRCAVEVMRELGGDARLGYGTSDEYSFVLARSTRLYERRTSKIVSTVASCFAANYVRWWPEYMGAETPLQATPIFDGRAVCYPDARTLRDYLSWRQADCHINNQYNTPYWELVKSGVAPPEAARTLAGTDRGFKNELLFSRFGINYNDLPAQFRKGSVIVRVPPAAAVAAEDDAAAAEGDAAAAAAAAGAAAEDEGEKEAATAATDEAAAKEAAREARRQRKQRQKQGRAGGGGELRVLHCDIIRDEPFWAEHGESILA